MKILNINRRTVNQVEIALPFETDAQVVAAWDHIFVQNRGLLDFSYRPDSEGEDRDRAFIEAFLDGQRLDRVMPLPSAEDVRRMLPKVWQAELNFDVRELIGVPAN